MDPATAVQIASTITAADPVALLTRADARDGPSVGSLARMIRGDIAAPSVVSTGEPDPRQTRPVDQYQGPKELQNHAFTLALAASSTQILVQQPPATEFRS
jgi:hypothetical protein